MLSTDTTDAFFLLFLYIFHYLNADFELFQAKIVKYENIKLLKPTGYVMHQQFNIQQL
jgi:hypothetical protein